VKQTDCHASLLLLLLLLLLANTLLHSLTVDCCAEAAQHCHQPGL
jgi:hypothetical protein